MSQLRTWVRLAWNYLREVSGENDYPRHRERELALGRAPMTPQEFYLWKINRQYSRLSRCC